VAQDDGHGVVRVRGAIRLIGRVEKDAGPSEHVAVVRLGDVKHHLVFSCHLVEPRLELRIGGGRRHPSRLGRALDGRDEVAQTHCGGARGEATQESAATAYEL
jgi:hypothetical protein